MCRLFGFRSIVPGRAHRSLMEAENALSRQSMRHPDGWGIGWYVDDDAYVIKSATAAHACERFKRASSRLSSHTMVVHVRRATVGTLDHLNAHPFRHGRWVLAHNGTVFSFGELRDWMAERTDEQFRPMVLGDTDSEHLFYYLLSRLGAAGIDRTGRDNGDPALVAEVVRAALFDLDREASHRGLERPIINILLTDGRLFLAHRAGMPLFMSTQKHFCADFATCAEPSKACMLATRPPLTAVNHLLVASERIGDENIWEPMEDGSTIMLDAGFQLSITAPPAGWSQPELPERFRTPKTGPIPVLV